MDESKVSRRDFLKGALAMTGGITIGSKMTRKNSDIIDSLSKMDMKKPNILLIMTDEQNPDIAGPYGNNLVQTPTMDKLAREGVTFDNCYCNSPLCCPSRMSFISGKYASRSNAWGNDCWLPNNDYPSIARVLKEAGYDAALAGKMHLDKTRDYGFDVIYRGWADRHHKKGLVSRRTPDDITVNYKSWQNRSRSFHPGNKSNVMSHDLDVTKYATEYIKNRRGDDRPFFLIAGYIAPHFPLTFPESYFDKYKGKIGMPNIPYGELPMQPMNYQQVRRGFGFINMDPKVELMGREMYYSGVNWIDDQAGQLLQVLDNSPFAQDTVVIFTSDHGENMGLHGMWWKNNMYDSAAKIPLIIRWPKRWKGGQRRKKVCSLLDIDQTILDLAGAKSPTDWNGDSMIPWLDNADYSWKDFAVSEYYAKHTVSGYTMYRSGKYKYVYHSKPVYPYPAERQFFDLESDAKEFVNLHDVPDYQKIIKDYHERMVQEIGENPDDTEIRCFRSIARPYKRKN